MSRQLMGYDTWYGLEPFRINPTPILGSNPPSSEYQRGTVKRGVLDTVVEHTYRQPIYPCNGINFCVYY